MTEIPLTELTTGLPSGDGVFDKLMASMKSHLELEFNKGRIKGPEYATVYLGALDQVLANSMAFVVQKRQVALQAQLLAQQIILAEVEVLKANIEREILEAGKAKIAAEVLQITAQTALTTQQTLNSVIEGTVLTAQKCKLEAEYDLLVNTNLKTTAEIQLLIQKTATEKAQVLELGVDANSVIGKQKALYTAQTEGFTRDAEQKAAKVMVDTWNARRMTDEATVADNTNMLNDSAVGRAVNKLLIGVGA
jgi:hypothetical protein